MHRSDLLRMVELENLDLLEAAQLPRALSGDVEAAQAVEKVHARRVVLLGLDTTSTP